MQSTGKSLAFINLIGQPDFTRHDDCPHFQSTSDRKKLLPNTHLFYWNFFRFTRGDNFLSISRNRNSDRLNKKDPEGSLKNKTLCEYQPRQNIPCRYSNQCKWDTNGREVLSFYLVALLCKNTNSSNICRCTDGGKVST